MSGFDQMSETFYGFSGIENFLKTAEYVSLGDDEAFDKAAGELDDMMEENESPKLTKQISNPPDWLSEEDTFNWFFLMDLINFHFYYDDWTEYTVTFKGKTFVGSMALAAAINRWLEVNPDAVKPEFLATVSKEDFKKALVDDSGKDAPMIDERYSFVKATYPDHLKIGGCVLDIFLTYKFNPRDVLHHLWIRYPCFDDAYSFNDAPVRFHKRAQLFIKDIFHNCPKSALSRGFQLDYHYFSVFADYRIPQMLRYYGLISYSDELEIAIKKGFLPNKKMEMEIRAFTVAAGERLRDISDIPPAIIDTLLWKKRRMMGKDFDEKYPFHKYRTTAY